MNLFEIIAFEITENIPCVANAVLTWPHDTNILRQIVALVILKHQKKSLFPDIITFTGLETIFSLY